MKPLPFSELETVYETLAEAIDRAGAANESLFLTKLVLLLAQRGIPADAFSAAIDAALADMPGR